MNMIEHGDKDDTNIDPKRGFATLRLWQLISPALPIGAYAYSQGLESAIEFGWVKDEDSAFHWMQGLLKHSLAHLDLPVLLRLFESWQHDDRNRVEQWNSFLLASRESAELLAEDQHLGDALRVILAGAHIDFKRDR